MQKKYKSDFPLLANRMDNDKPLAYLDNAATTQKPAVVIEAVKRHMEYNNANPHRGAYTLSADATGIYEDTRIKAARFIHAASENEIVFTKNTTEALNMVALCYGMEKVKQGDEILISIAEHHSNLLPWQRVAVKTGASLRYLYTNSDSEIPAEEIRTKINKHTKVVAITHTSNVLGYRIPVGQIVQAAHAVGAVVVVDGAQGVPHMPVDVQALDVDFMAFAGHKMYGPEGIGILYGKAALLDEMEPLLLGGGIVEQVTESSACLLPAPHKFEAGTPNVAAAAGLNAAMEYMQQIGFDKIRETEDQLTDYLLDQLRRLDEVEIYGSRHYGIAPFNVRDVHPHDVASILDGGGVAIRAGHHCAQPLMKHLGINACCRASIAFYNTKEDIDRLYDSLKDVRRWLGL